MRQEKFNFKIGSKRLSAIKLPDDNHQATMLFLHGGEIMGTLYNIDDVDNPITPHGQPEANDFGRGVARNYQRVKQLLGA